LKTLLLPGATRKILIMVKAGAPVDAVIDQLKPLLTTLSLTVEILSMKIPNVEAEI